MWVTTWSARQWRTVTGVAGYFFLSHLTITACVCFFRGKDGGVLWANPALSAQTKWPHWSPCGRCLVLWYYTMREDQVGGISEIRRPLYVLLQYAYSQNSNFSVLCYICGFCLVAWQRWICQSSLDIPVVSKLTDEKLFLEQAGSLCARLPLLLCFDVLGANVSESKRSILIKGGARSCKKHALLHMPKERIQRSWYKGVNPAFPLLCLL